MPLKVCASYLLLRQEKNNLASGLRQSGPSPVGGALFESLIRATNLVGFQISAGGNTDNTSRSNASKSTASRLEKFLFSMKRNIGRWSGCARDQDRIISRQAMNGWQLLR